MKPLARREGVVVRDLSEETLVYDLERHQAHCLNRPAAAVFRLCDGTHNVAEIASLLDGPPGEAESAELGPRRAWVEAALRQLAEAHLLVGADASPAPAEAFDPSRRELLRRAGTALLVPAIASIVAPTPTQAASVCVNEDECWKPEYHMQQCWTFDPESQCNGSYCCDWLGGGTCDGPVVGNCP